MGVFHHEEPPNDPKRCTCLAANLKEIFAHCRTFGGRLSTASLEEDYPISDFDEEQQVNLIYFTTQSSPICLETFNQYELNDSSGCFSSEKPSHGKAEAHT
ncbi:hypothetical protein L6164_024674 [Bauhinia variegata]|uniref:Uncharacterized protein n=1 Tax=Bauhinia variegata TaxID=167791 RepID=A0ACB9LYA0_BAUVA|nr:hypothetical protein L6164_024674 [Bauhinia variegata]